MAIQIGQRPDHDFDEPLGLLSDCHRRIEHFLRVLIAVDAEAAGGALTETRRVALEGAVKYFTLAGPKHTADEEESLFPRLRGSSDPVAIEALALVERLERDHDQAEKHHAAIESLVRLWIADDGLPPSQAADLREHLGCLQTLYERHIAVEDKELFPAAARVLDAATLRDIGCEMAARRKPLSDSAAPHMSTSREDIAL
jgi:hemerythrin-like domain-containing protein